MDLHRKPSSALGAATGVAMDLPTWAVGLRDAQSLRTFTPSAMAFAATFIGLMFGLVRYTHVVEGPQAEKEMAQYYSWFIDVNFMVWIGFGFLMTFLRRYCLSAVCLNMLASVVMFLEAILCIGAVQQVFWGHKANTITVDLPLLIDSTFCAASGMIAFGAVIGRVTPTQLMWMVFAQVPLYAINLHLVVTTLKALDVGGTLGIHLFGAYYGLAVSLVMRSIYPQPATGFSVPHPKLSPSHLNDVFSMIGTIFLFLYWPSFNGALGSVPLAVQEAGNVPQERRSVQFLCAVNTLLSLMGAVLSTFTISSLVGRGRVNAMHVQNSTLAGGVAMGAACSLHLTPGASILVGMCAGALSVCGYQYLSPFLERRGLGDTCGVHNLHGMPAILGGLVAGLASLTQDAVYLNHPTGRLQLGYQVAAMVVTVAIAIGGGLVVGWLLCFLNPTRAPHLHYVELFDDGLFWEGVSVEPLAPAATTFEPSKHSVYSVSRRDTGGFSVHRPTRPPPATGAASSTAMGFGINEPSPNEVSHHSLRAAVPLSHSHTPAVCLNLGPHSPA